MANILSLDDFKGGKYNIPDASSSIANAYERVTEAITLYENKYLNRLLGVAFAAIIKPYIIAGSTATPDYNKIIDALSYQPKGCMDIFESEGIKVLLKACILYEYTRNQIKNTISGAAVLQAEVANTLSPAGALRNSETYYNGIIDTAETIQQYCFDNPSIYTDYDGRRFTIKASGFL